MSIGNKVIYLRQLGLKTRRRQVLVRQLACV